MNDERPRNLATVLATVLVILLIPCGNASAAMPPASAQNSVATPSRIALNASWAQVLNKNVALAQRQQALSKIE